MLPFETVIVAVPDRRQIVFLIGMLVVVSSKSNGCVDSPGQLSLGVSGAISGSRKNYYAVQIPNNAG